VNENKDRSIFRKNIGRALLNKDNDPFIEQWNKKNLAKKLKKHWILIPMSLLSRKKLKKE